jgi:hypothetical protein
MLGGIDRMDFPPLPTKKPTPSEYAVIAVGSSGLLIVLGLVGFGFRIFAAPQKPEVTAALTHYSAWSLGIGVFIAFCYWLFRRLMD